MYGSRRMVNFSLLSAQGSYFTRQMKVKWSHQTGENTESRCCTDPKFRPQPDWVVHKLIPENANQLKATTQRKHAAYTFWLKFCTITLRDMTCFCSSYVGTCSLSRPNETVVSTLYHSDGNGVKDETENAPLDEDVPAGTFLSVVRLWSWNKPLGGLVAAVIYADRPNEWLFEWPFMFTKPIPYTEIVFSWWEQQKHSWICWEFIGEEGRGERERRKCLGNIVTHWAWESMVVIGNEQQVGLVCTWIHFCN